MLINSDISLFILCLDDLSVGESGVLKSPTFNGLILICGIWLCASVLFGAERSVRDCI